jgi:hypothetical protein
MWRRYLICRENQKPPPRGWCGDGFSQYETTDVPMWPRPKPLFPSKKPPLGVEISDGFSTLHTRDPPERKVTADGDGLRLTNA